MQTPRLAGIRAVVIAVCATAGAFGESPTSTEQQELSAARVVHSLPPEEAALKLPVQLRAVVTYYDPFIDARHGALFVQDTSGGVFVSVPSRPILPLHAGDLVSVKGVTGAGDYAPIVTAEDVSVVGTSKLPASPPRTTLAEMQTGVNDGQWVEIEGRVRSAHLQAMNVFLEVATDGGSLTATSIREDGADYESLVDSLVLIHGNVAPQFNQRRQMVGVHVFFPSLAQIEVTEAAPANPFAVAAVPVSQLFRFSPEQSLLHRVHVRGRVTLDWPGRALCIEDANDGLCIETAQALAVAPGAQVDVVGFPVIRQFKPTLEDATFRAAEGSPASLPPVAVPGGGAPGDNLDGKLIRIDAELIGKDLAADNPTLMLRSGRFLFPGILPKEEAGAAAGWKEGSALRLTGIWNVEVDPQSTNLGEGGVRAGSMQLLLRNASDVVVLRVPSWWTPRHAVAALGGAGIVVLAAFLWIVILRHRVSRQTKALRESEARLRYLSEHDSLTGLPNRILLNDRLQTGLLRAERFGSCLGVLMIDVDGFKQVNDKFGHQAGDMLLCELATRLTDCIRATDTIARIGGDEFVILLSDLHFSSEAVAVAAKIVGAVTRPVVIGRARSEITVSIGVVTFPDSGRTVKTLIERADAAMYAAKASGKNGFRVYAPAMTAAGSDGGRKIPHAPGFPLTEGNAYGNS
jgi:diguanylate cyclase (GGDEF)-like protein